MTDAARLAGVRIVVTRPVEVADRLVGLLRGAGGEVVELPLIEVVDPLDGGAALGEALSRLATFDWLVVTSVNGAVRCREALARCAAGTPRVAAVGPATAEALGRQVDLVPERRDAEGILEMMPPPGPGASVLVPQADRARNVLVEGLTARGWVTEAVVAYRTIGRVPSPRALDEAITADVVVFASGSAVESWAAVVSDRPGPAVVSIGPVTSATVRRCGLEVAAEASEPTPEAVVAAVEQAVDRARSGRDDRR